jgi:hypothetical protein
MIKKHMSDPECWEEWDRGEGGGGERKYFIDITIKPSREH